MIFVLMAWLELKHPKRLLSSPRQGRWSTNLAIVAIDSAIVRGMAWLSVPLAATAAAEFAASSRFGFLHWLDAPDWIAFPVSIAALDFAVWLQHLASHKVPMLWRLHQMHHADTVIDVTTAIRFHPIEIAGSMLWKIACVMALGVPVMAVLLFEVLLNVCAVFNHANVALPAGLDRILRTILVTPDMHRVHHSVISGEHNSNYGFNFPFWDRWFHTYTPEPAAGHGGMTIGLAAYQSDGPRRLGWCLMLPFRPSAKQTKSHDRHTGSDAT